MENFNNQLVLRQDDHSLLSSLLKGLFGESAYDRRNVEGLQNELKRAILVNKDKFPADVVRLDSMVKIKAEDKDEIMELMLVTPDKANIKQKKISVMAPVGTALLGFRKGEKVKWKVPAGEKTFIIMDVINAF